MIRRVLGVLGYVVAVVVVAWGDVSSATCSSLRICRGQAVGGDLSSASFFFGCHMLAADVIYLVAYHRVSVVVLDADVSCRL